MYGELINETTCLAHTPFHASTMSDKVYTLAAPPSREDAKPPVELTENEQDMYEKVLKHFSSPEYALPGIEKGQLKEEEKFWLSKECIVRCVPFFKTS